MKAARRKGESGRTLLLALTMVAVLASIAQMLAGLTMRRVALFSTLRRAHYATIAVERAAAELRAGAPRTIKPVYAVGSRRYQVDATLSSSGDVSATALELPASGN